MIQSRRGGADPLPRLPFFAVLPEGVPLRQYVLTLPFELRARLAYDRELIGAVGRIFVDSVLGFYARKSGEHSS